MSREEYKSLKTKKRNKFSAIKTKVDGVTFDSKAEARRYGELKFWEKSGGIKHLRCHPTYGLTVWAPSVDCDGKAEVGSYEPDFEYLDASGQLWVEDVKSPATVTPLYKLKRNIFIANHPEIEFVEVFAARRRKAT